MNLYYFKGFESEYSGEKFKHIVKTFKNDFSKIIEIQYPSLELSYDEFLTEILEQIDGECVVVGSSFGGYWAAIVANRVDCLACVNINPATTDYVGNIFKSSIIEYSVPIIGCYTILGQNDDLFLAEDYIKKYKNKCRITIDKHGNHRNVNPNIITNAIRESINYGFNSRIV